MSTNHVKIRTFQPLWTQFSFCGGYIWCIRYVWVIPAALQLPCYMTSCQLFRTWLSLIGTDGLGMTGSGISHCIRMNGSHLNHFTAWEDMDFWESYALHKYLVMTITRIITFQANWKHPKGWIMLISIIGEYLPSFRQFQLQVVSDHHLEHG